MNWEPYTGCVPCSIGCKNCYFYGPEAKRYGQNEIAKTDKFDLPIRRNSKGEYKIKGGKIMATCFGTDFFIEGADGFRKEIWQMIKVRKDIDFLILTKRIDRFYESLPPDWKEGYENVRIGVSVENQEEADKRLSIFVKLPIKYKFIACAPLLERLDLTKYIKFVDHVSVGGETSRNARLCDYDWVLDLRNQCKEANKTFWFKNTGSLFRINSEVIKVNPFKQTIIAKELNINIFNAKRLF